MKEKTKKIGKSVLEGKGNLKNIMFFLMILSLSILPVLAICDKENYCTYNENGNLTFFVSNITNNQPITSANCYLDIWNQLNTKITDDGSVIEDSEGKYYYTISGSETNNNGVYAYIVNCTKDSYNSFFSNSYQIVNYTPINYLDNINQWNTTYFSNWNTYIYNIYTNVTQPISTLILNMFSYFDGRLTTSINETDKRDIANKTWETNITIPQETGDPRWRIDPNTLRKYGIY